VSAALGLGRQEADAAKLVVVRVVVLSCIHPAEPSSADVCCEPAIPDRGLAFSFGLERREAGRITEGSGQNHDEQNDERQEDRAESWEGRIMKGGRQNHYKQNDEPRRATPFPANLLS
jgi:hypothetical protein